MSFIYSFFKSYKLNKISKIISQDMGNSNIDNIFDTSKSKKQDKAKSDLFKFCEKDRFIKRELKHHKVGRKELEELYLLLLANGAAQWERGHFVLISIFFYNATLDYCLSREKVDVSVERMIIRCLDYFANGETGLINPHWSQNQ